MTKNLQFRRNRHISGLSSKKQKYFFIIMNLMLLLGGAAIGATAVYLLSNFHRADEIVLNCLPGFVLGLSLCIGYAILHQGIGVEHSRK